MPTSYTSLLGLALPVTGELSGTWGDTVNDYITKYLDAAVAGAQTISGSQTAVTLSTTTAANLTQVGSGSTGSAQYQIINCTGNPAGLLTITAPAQSKVYLVLNATSTSQSVKVVGTGPTTGVTLVSGERALIAWNGSDFVKVATTAAGAAAGSNTQVQFNSSGNLAGSANLTFDGTNLTLGGGTANGVAYLNGSKALTTGSALTFDGTGLSVTGSTSATLKLNGRASDNASSANFYDNTGATRYGFIYFDPSNAQIATANANPLAFLINSSEQMRLTSTGLGIGTSSPANAIEVSRGSGVPAGISLRGNGNTSGNEFFVGQSSAGDAFVYQRANAPLYFGTNNTTRVTLDASGNVGIGTSSPSAYGNLVLVRTQNSDTRMWVRNEDAGSSARASYVINAAGNSWSMGMGSTANNGNALTWVTDVGGGNNEMMRLTTTGNLGLGVTPSAWTSYTPMQLRNGSIYGWSGGNSFVGVAANTFFGGSPAGYRYISSDFATEYYQFQGSHIWRTAPSGTAGNPISFTQAMTLDASGNLAIGTTSPQGKLHVSSTTSSVTWGSPGGQAQITGSTVIGDIGTSGGSLAVRTNSLNGVYASGFGVDGTYDAPSGVSTINLKAFGVQAGGFGSVLAFSTTSGATLTERARITSTGNFLVGTTTNPSGSGVICDANGNVRAIPQSGAAKTGSYTLATTDVGEFINVGSGGSVTIPTSTFATGDVVSIYNDTTGNVTITCSAPTTYVAGVNTARTSLTLATRGVATVLFISATVCVVSGNVS